jgi:hypothetical protein
MAILERTVVRATRRMSNETFEKHMEARHAGSLGYLEGLPLGDAYLMRMWRAFHRQLHKFRVDLEHEHSEA